MEGVGETCKLCLKYIQGDDLAVLDETILGKLEFLQMDLDQSVEESNSLCKECEEKIESAFDFKSCLVNTESCLVPYVSEDKTQKVNLRVILEKDASSSSKGESSAEKDVCRLCKNFVNANTVISLPKILKDDSIMEVFQGHIPEMDLEVTENPMVCDSCHNSLTTFSTLIASWSIANGWNEDDEDMKEDYDVLNVKNETLDGFSDSNTNSSASYLEVSGSGASSSKNGQTGTPKVKTEIDDLTDSTSESASVPKKGIKKEEGGDAAETEEDLQLKSEEVDIKDEDGGCTQNTDTSKTNINRSVDELETHNCDHPKTFKPEHCPYVVTEDVNHGKRHEISRKTLKEVKIFKCPDCSYTTKHMHNLTRHEVTHKKSFKCPDCPYTARYKSRMRHHRLKHELKKAPKTLKCEHCDYVTNNLLYLEYHNIIHRSIR